MTTTTPTTCTVVTGATGARCGAPAVATFTGRGGVVFAECVAHTTGAPAAAVPVAHPPTRTTKPFVLVRGGRIIGYADTAGPAVVRRAARLGAVIVPV